QQPSTDAPEATTATPSEDTYGTDAPTPAPTGIEGLSEETPVPTSPEQQPSTDAPEATTGQYDVDVRPTRIKGVETRYQDLPTLQEHKMCA
ncbi:hypothetical protein L917_07305, partial [Phytophthora nicotianae]